MDPTCGMAGLVWARQQLCAAAEPIHGAEQIFAEGGLTEWGVKVVPSAVQGPVPCHAPSAWPWLELEALGSLQPRCKCFREAKDAAISSLVAFFSSSDLPVLTSTCRKLQASARQSRCQPPVVGCAAHSRGHQRASLQGGGQEGLVC